jgi:hypothetical protein
MIEPLTIVESPLADKLETVPDNIIFFPSHLCWKAGVVRKLTVRVPKLTAFNVLPLPQGASSNRGDVRGLFAEIWEILMRSSREWLSSNRWAR